ncbi:MAG: CocE/NonD family hydrolase [Pseudomonadota bacterium]
MRLRQCGVSTGLLIGVLGLSACGDSGGRPSVEGLLSTVPGSAAISCTTKLPRSAKDYTLVVNIPSDSDPTAANITPTTKISYTVMLPERCPGEVFPVIVQSHGYSGTRQKAIDADGMAAATRHFAQIDELTTLLPYKGYVVLSYDERGHGESKPANGGGYARIIDNEAEVRDAQAILDWMWDNASTGGKGAEQLPVQTEHARTGIAKDIRLGSIGLSYGGGFQLPLAALDPRLDTIVPNGTWHNLLYSLIPGDATKNGFTSLLCLLASGATDTSSTDKPAVINTPVVATACNLLGPTNANANNIRTRADLAAAGADPSNPAVNGNTGNQGQTSRAITENEVVDLFFGHGMAFFKKLEQTKQPYAAGQAPFKLRPVPALFIQGNRDSLFNLTEAYLNYSYFKAAGSPATRILSTEGGHMNPFAYQLEGSANCGGFDTPKAIYAWFDFQLKGIRSAAYDAIPEVCISVADTPAPSTLPAPAAVKLASFPVGSLSGTGAQAALLANGTAAVTPQNVETMPAFVKVTDISGDGYVIAGIPTLDSITVAAGTPASAVTPVAYVGVGIRRGGSLILVDQQLTPFVMGTHSNNRNFESTDNIRVLLPGVGEQLQSGDEVGLVFYCTHVQYQSVISSSVASGAAGAGGQTNPLPFSPPNVTSCINNYNVSFTNAALPILLPGTYPGATLSRP